MDRGQRNTLAETEKETKWRKKGLAGEEERGVRTKYNNKNMKVP